MDTVNTLILWLHFIGLVLGAVANLGIPLTAARLAGAEPAARPALAGLIQTFSKVGSSGLGVLILTGLGLIYGKFQGFGGHSPFFYAKLVLVVALIGLIVVNKRLGARAMKGDVQAAALARKLSLVAMVLLASIILLAVLAFG